MFGGKEKKKYFSPTILKINREKAFATISSPKFQEIKTKKDNLPFLYLVFLVLLTYKQESLENTKWKK